MKRQRCKHCGHRLDYDEEIGLYCRTTSCPWMHSWWRRMWDEIIDKVFNSGAYCGPSELAVYDHQDRPGGSPG